MTFFQQDATFSRSPPQDLQFKKSFLFWTWNTELKQFFCRFKPMHEQCHFFIRIRSYFKVFLTSSSFSSSLLLIVVFLTFSFLSFCVLHIFSLCSVSGTFRVFSRFLTFFCVFPVLLSNSERKNLAKISSCIYFLCRSCSKRKSSTL